MKHQKQEGPRCWLWCIGRWWWAPLTSVNCRGILGKEKRDSVPSHHHKLLALPWFNYIILLLTICQWLRDLSLNYMAWHWRPPQPNYISSEQPLYQKPFDQLTPSAFSTHSISTSPQDLPVSGQRMIPKLAWSSSRESSVRFSVTGRRDSENGFSKVTWCLTLHEERPKAVNMLIAHVGCGSGELENSFVW